MICFPPEEDITCEWLDENSDTDWSDSDSLYWDCYLTCNKQNPEAEMYNWLRIQPSRERKNSFKVHLCRNPVGSNEEPTLTSLGLFESRTELNTLIMLLTETHSR